MLGARPTAVVALLAAFAGIAAYAPDDAEAAVAEPRSGTPATAAPSCEAPCRIAFHRKGEGRGVVRVRTAADGERVCPLDTEPVCLLVLDDTSQVFVAEPVERSGSTFRGWELCLEQVGPNGKNCRINATATDFVCVIFTASDSERPPEGCPPMGAPPDPPPARDTIPPTTRITSGPARTTASRRATFRFRANEVGRFQCRLDRQRWAACRSPKTYTRLKPSLHVFRVRAIDRAGNVDPTPAVRKWRIRR